MILIGTNDTTIFKHLSSIKEPIEHLVKYHINKYYKL